MNFSIIIPTFNNFNYLKLAITSLKKNSYFNNQIIIHINGNDIETENYLKKNDIEFTKSTNNIGLCSGVNFASKKVLLIILFMLMMTCIFFQNGIFLFEEIKSINSNLFYFSSSQISHIPDKGGKGIANHVFFDAGDSIENFKEKELLENFEQLKFHDLQGSHWAPHVIHKDIWNKIGGFSEEFDPGFGSDPDLNMKLWQLGVRIFKGVNKSRIYHFGSLTTRKNKDIIQNNARKTFLLKWKISMELFINYYLRRGQIYNGPLKKPSLTISFLKHLISSNIKYFFYKWKKD